MPIIKSAKKALRQTERRTVFNRRLKSKAKQTIKAFEKNPTKDNLKKAYSALDKAVKRNIFHKNKAARTKGKLSKLLVKKPPKSPSKKKATGKKSSSAKAMKKK